MNLRIIFSLMLGLFVAPNVLGKDWRGIVPLKSTRADVESRFGKPDKWGEYKVNDERVSFHYSEGSCKGLYETLGKDNCKCLLQKDTVISIFVEPTIKRKFSDLKLDLTRFKRTAIAPFPHTFAYYNPTEGVDYTVDESEDEVTTVDYYATPDDCQNIVKKRTPKQRNSWRGLVPLASNRKDVEALFGASKRGWRTAATYETGHESILAKYSNGNCAASTSEWNVPKDTLIELTVNPNPSFLSHELHLDPRRYERHEIFPYPEINNPPQVWNYVDNLNGITIRTQSAPGGEGEEVVVSITYQPTRIDDKLRCNNSNKSVNGKP
jgi:hypothetical protein